MKFLIEKDILGNIPFDFQEALVKSKSFLDWKVKDNNMTIEYFESDGNDALPKNMSIEKMKEYCPVGCVEVVTHWLKHVYGIDYVPLQMPNCLMKYNFLHRQVIKGIPKDIPTALQDEYWKDYKKYFVKDISQLKSFTEILTKDELIKIDKLCLISDVVDFISEYRVFVYKNEIVGCKNYSGDCLIFPEPAVIRNAVKTYATNDAPIAYTIDFGIHHDTSLDPCVHPHQDTSLIELHDFFSVGLYGFNDYAKIPFMFNRWWKEYLRKNNVL